VAELEMVRPSDKLQKRVAPDQRYRETAFEWSFVPVIYWNAGEFPELNARYRLRPGSMRALRSGFQGEKQLMHGDCGASHLVLPFR
jgi:hypothetical protein